MGALGDAPLGAQPEHRQVGRHPDTSVDEGGDAVGGLVEALVRHRQAHAHEPLAAGPVGRAGRDHHGRLLEHPLGERGGGLAVGHAGPDVDRALRRVHPQADPPKRGDQHVAAALVDRAHLHHGRLIGAQGGGGGLLDGLEHTAVDVRLELPVGADEVGVAHHGPGPPAGHVVGLREREDLDPHLHGARRLEERGRAVAVVRDLGVGVVVHDDQLVTAGERDRPLEEVVLDDPAGGVVGVVEEHHPRAGGDVRRDGLQVGLEPQLRQEGHGDRLGARQQRPGGVDGVARIAGQGDVAGVEEGQVDVGHGLLGAQRGDDLRGGVEGDAEARRVEAGHGLAEGRPPPVGRVLVGVRAADLVAHGGDHHLGGRRVGVADAQRDDVDALGPLGRDLLLDLGEQVRGQPPEPLGPDDARRQSSSSARTRSGDSSPR